MGGPVEIQIHRIRRLHGILRLIVALMQTDRRQGNLAVGNIAQVRGQIDPAHHFRRQQIGVEAVEWFADVGLFAVKEEARKQFPCRTDIDIAVFIARITERHEIRIDGGSEFPAPRRLKFRQILHGGQHPRRIPLFIRHGEKHQIAGHFFRLSGKMFHHHQQGSHAGFHVQNAPAQQPVRRQDFRQCRFAEFRRQRQFLLQGGGIGRQFLQSAIIGDPYRVDVAEAEQRFFGVREQSSLDQGEYAVSS